MQLPTPITLTIDSKEVTISKLTIKSITDSPLSRRVWVYFSDAKYPITIWSGEAYDTIGDWTQAQLEDALTALVARDPEGLVRAAMGAIPPKPTSYPTADEMAKNLANSMANWAKKGFKLATSEQVAARLEVCKACPEWDGEALAGTGRCRKCGCSTQAKLRLATEKCPIDKWGPVVS
jgi:hypothetical protein